MPVVCHWVRQNRMVAIAIFATLFCTAQATFAQVPAVPPPIGTAFVATTDFSTGSYSVIDLTTLATFNDITPGGIHSDALARYDSAMGQVYVVNRDQVDSIQLIDPQLGYITPTGSELSVGNGSNPQDIALISPTKAYVSRAKSAQLLIINPTTLTELGVIDLSNLIKPTDLDDSPEPFRMLVHGDSVYLILQHLDRLMQFQPPLAPGEVVVIDALMDMVTAVIPLATQNPFSDLQFTAALPQGPRILVSSVHDFGVLDAGIEAIDPATNTVDAGFVLAETAVNGDINFFKVLSATQAYAVVGLADGSFTNALVRFDPSTGQPVSTLASGLAFTLNFAINNAGQLYLGPVDTTSPTPGVRIFDTASDMELTAAPISVGNLPPGWIVMVEEPQVALIVRKAGTGEGTVSSMPEGLECGPTCTHNFALGAMVSLTATPSPGSVFTGWTGACTGAEGCQVTLNHEAAVTATFAPANAARVAD